MDHPHEHFPDPWDNGVYGTGKTEPPKNNSGTVALLMIIIIFLSGIVSGLSFLNIRLFQQLQEAQYQAESAPMAFADLEDVELSLEKQVSASASSQSSFQHAAQNCPALVEITQLGLTGEFITAFDQHYFSWPQGIMVTNVIPDSAAQAMGMKTGDIILSVNGYPLGSDTELEAFCRADKQDHYEILIFREEEELLLTGK